MNSYMYLMSLVACWFLERLAILNYCTSFPLTDLPQNLLVLTSKYSIYSSFGGYIH